MTITCAACGRADWTEGNLLRCAPCGSTLISRVPVPVREIDTPVTIPDWRSPASS